MAWTPAPWISIGPVQRGSGGVSPELLDEAAPSVGSTVPELEELDGAPDDVKSTPLELDEDDELVEPASSAPSPSGGSPTQAAANEAEERRPKAKYA